MTRPPPIRLLLWRASAALPVLCAAAAFYGPALEKTGGVWPAPLDDVYIYFGFARAAALGHPLSWIPGNGYSSGATSVAYPLVLAPGYLLGFRGVWLGLFAALLACAALLDLCRSLRRLLGRAPHLEPAAGGGSSGWVAWVAPLFVVAVPLLDWSWFSGMEVALFGAVLGRALVAARRAELAPPARRPAEQLRAGLLCALLVATRPEAIALAAPLAVAVAHAAGSLGAAASLARASLPTALLLAAQAVTNRALTGEWSAAGAVRKLVLSNPYPTPIEKAAEVIRNLAALRVQALESALGGPSFSWILPLLGALAALDRRSRRLAAPLLVGAYGSLLLVALNTTARYQNLRYAAPALAMLLVAAALGAEALARRGRLAALVAGALALAGLAAPSRWFGRQIDHFARASANIAGQHVEVARRLAARAPRPRRVLLGDAGAIPYLSGIPAIDGLGLGGYRGMPFARASVHGVPAVVELIERLGADERPDAFALYPSWWGGLADVFGRRVDAVKIEDNVMCAADEKVIYEADWSALAPPGERRDGAVDEVDIADLIDERAHRYAFPTPRGGWVVGAVLQDDRGAPRFDAGRLIPEGREQSFTIGQVARGPAVLALRTDGGGPSAIGVAVERVAGEVRVEVPERPADRWSEIRVPLRDVAPGDVVRVRALQGTFRSFHVWLLRP
ncbi:hypothetical protein SOCEGT47_018180 [Sorangium cellulosum]|uniref:Uncharacterized protein n=1 Tax=Sorangium cellulosum TaxID=56 RepID=A0A4P2PXQ6_SORCE|nr:hypothetical protein [Sorangium cellulosum]AUX21336.1 hypothetical protein SOCEGT47_018180 [Sorangium cellulosum]